ncbi:MAG TPA: VWA domain-containing protein, partial [Kofleriaceae bacterium]|nr:VWA domain-containing protein [Kofleriaceae bacterium]
PLVSAAGDPDFTVRVRVTAPPLTGDARPPLELALLLDTSASMDGDAIAAARDAARTMVTRMTARDHVAIISFDSSARTLVPMTLLDDRGRARALAAIDGIRATGTTDLTGGLSAGLDELVRNRTGTGMDRMVLLSDGVPNDGENLQALVSRATQEHVAVSVIGLGLEFDEALLGRIAQDTGGEYRYAPDAEAVARIFDEEVTRMQTVVASNLTLTVKPGPGVTILDAPWLTAAAAGHRQAFLGDLAAGESRDVFVPVRLEPHAAGATVEILDADLDLMIPGTSQAETRHAFVGARASADDEAIARSLVVDLATGRARADAAGVILQAIGLARQGLVDRAEQLLVDGERAARAAAAAHHDDELEQAARRMVDLRKSLVYLRTAQLVAPPPPSPIPGPPPTAQVDVDGVAPVAPYPLARRPTPQAPADVETTIKAAYDESSATLAPTRAR